MSTQPETVTIYRADAIACCLCVESFRSSIDVYLLTGAGLFAAALGELLP